jgi:hypothetical protein
MCDDARMVGVRVTCVMSGAGFSPALAERSSGLTLQHKSEPGEPDALTGKPSPLGHAELLIQEFGNLVDLGAREGTVLMALARSLEAFRRAGATDLKVRIEIEYAGHCQFELPAELLRRLADLAIPVVVSAFPTDETEDLASRSLG